MARERDCDYCGGDIEPGTGTMLVRTNGSTVHFCSSKCEKNADLGREARDLEWTDAGRPETTDEEEPEEEADEAETEAVEDEAETEEDEEAEAEEETETEAEETEDQTEEAADADEETPEEETEAEA